MSKEMDKLRWQKHGVEQAEMYVALK
jgi:hypothetical protein